MGCKLDAVVRELESERAKQLEINEDRDRRYRRNLCYDAQYDPLSTKIYIEEQKKKLRDEQTLLCN